MKKIRVILATLVTLGILGSMVCLADSIPQPSYPSLSNNVTITWWSWTSNADKTIANFNKAYPNIHVVHPTIGSGSTEYTKLQTVLKAGTGAPDVVQIEYQYIPQFIDTNGLLDISKYVNPYKSYFQSWTWNQVSRGSKVYAVPEDIGPLGFLYRPDIFNKYGLTVPKTYSDLAAQAEKFHNANPSMYYTYFPVNDPGEVTGLFWQAGANLFKYDSSSNTWTININSATDKKVLNFWGNLIKKGYVKGTNDWSVQWESEIGSGLYACTIGAAWSPTYEIAPYVKASTSNWNAADTPQWDSSKFVNGNWGGSTNAVTTQSKNPEAAALFASWINSSESGVNFDTEASGRGLFPADKYGTQLSSFNAPNTALSNQLAGDIWSKAAKAVDVSFQWSPWTDYVYKQMTSELTKANQGSETWDQALDNVQNSTVNFAKSMGYKVKSGSAANTAKSSSGVATGVIAVAVIVVLAAAFILIKRFKKSKRQAG